MNSHRNTYTFIYRFNNSFLHNNEECRVITTSVVVIKLLQKVTDK